MNKFLLKTFCLCFVLASACWFVQAAPISSQERNGDFPVQKARPGSGLGEKSSEQMKKKGLPPVKRPGSKRIPGNTKPVPVEKTVPVFTLPGSHTVLCGTLVYSDKWANPTEEITAGIYTWKVQENVEPEMVHKDSKMMYARAAVKVNNRYYMIRVKNDTDVYYTIYDATTWEPVSDEEIDINSVASDLTLDPVSNKVYGIFYNEYGGSYNYFGTLDLLTGLPQIIGEVPEMFALAADKDGIMYGISYNGRLYTIDKANAEFKEIGKTGEWPKYVQSAAFDPATNKLYWAATLDTNKGVLYEVNTKTAKLTQISSPSYNPGFAGLYALPYTVSEDAPAPAENIEVSFSQPGALTGTVSFTVPEQTVGGIPLTGTLSAALTINSTEQPEISGLVPGNRYTSPILDFTAGMQEITVTVFTPDITSETVTYQAWAGVDIPGKITALTLSKTTDGKAHLSWDAPASGEHDGYIDPAALAYKIVRYPDLTTVCESTDRTDFTDESIGSALGSYSYEVSARSEAGAGQPVQSESMLFGEAFGVPYLETFDTENDLSLWTIVNSNGGTTWGYYDDKGNGRAVYNYDSKLAGDDWLISPPIRLEGGKAYKLSYFARNEAKGYPEDFKITLGTSNSPDTHTTIIAEHTTYESPKGETFARTIRIDTDGEYYVGFYACSPKNMWRLYIDDVRLESFSALLPDSVTSLTAEAAPLGALSATLSFVTPDVSFDGNPLGELTKVDIYRNKDATPAKTFLSPATGTPLTWTDTQPVNGINTYKVIASNEDGSGVEASVSVFVGIDVPGPVSDLVLKDVDGNAVLSWNAPQQGANGGYFDASDIGYRIVRSDGIRIEDYFNGTSYTDNTVSKTEQVFVYYVVTPYAGETKGTFNTTNEVIFGKPYPAPFHESFAGADLQNYPWITETFSYMEESWTLEPNGYQPDAAPQDKDGGLASFHAYGQEPETSARFYSPKIDISRLNHPKLSFWFFHHTDAEATGDDRIQAEISVNGGEYRPLPNGLIHRSSAGNEGWKYYSFPLDDYKNDASYIQLGFLGISGQGMNMHLDNVSIEDGFGTDLEARTLTGPARIAAGEKAVYTLFVQNKGAGRVTDYTVSLYKNGEITNTLPGIAVNPGETVSIGFEVQTGEAGSQATWKASLQCTADENEANNTAPEITTQVVTPVLPRPGTLSGEVTDNNIELTWEPPITSGLVTDDIESLKDFAIADLGEWTVIDRDGARTVGMGGDDITAYDNKYDPKAFQVLNPDRLGLSSYIQPHSGARLLMSIASNGTPNDDWLISPRLNGAAQTVRFFARSFIDTYGLERIRMLYSTADSDPDHFVSSLDVPYIEVPVAWTEYTIDLPEGTNYFAINCISDDAFALFLDDFSYNDQTVATRPGHTGFRVYRDGSSIREVPADCTNYADTALQTGTYTYRITGLYEQGETSPSNEVPLTVLWSAVDEISGSAVTIRTEPGQIIVLGADHRSLRLYTPEGRIIDSRIGTERTVLSAQPGFYLIAIDNLIRKIIVP